MPVREAIAAVATYQLVLGGDGQAIGKDCDSCLRRHRCGGRRNHWDTSERLIHGGQRNGLGPKEGPEEPAGGRLGDRRDLCTCCSSIMEVAAENLQRRSRQGNELLGIAAEKCPFLDTGLLDKGQ